MTITRASVGEPQPQGRATHSRCAFTRTDLLVTAAALMLLAPLLTGAGKPANARTAGCLSNLRKFADAMALYAEDNRGFYSGNLDDLSVGRNWISGFAGTDGPDFGNEAILSDPKSSLLGSYLQGLLKVFRCPANRVTQRVNGRSVPQARNYSLNGAVGTNPGRPGKVAVDGPWLDGVHGHTLGRTWHTYSGPASVVAPGPAQLFTFVDEDPYSVNDGSFAMTMVNAEWLDWPASLHEGGGTFAFADLHVDHRRWQDSRTKVTGTSVIRRPVPNSPDHLWLQQRTSAKIQL